MSQKFFIFTDGASRGNPGPGGWGTIVVEVVGDVAVSSGRLIERGDMIGKVTELGGSEANTTNNRMELQAVIGGLNLIATQLHLENQEKEVSEELSILVYTDSSYVLRGATEWLAGWEAKNWRTSTKTDVLNKDLWETLSATMKQLRAQGTTLNWHLLSGHVGVAGNERADEIATEYADSLSGFSGTTDPSAAPKLYAGPLENYKLDILNISHDATQKGKRSESKERSRAKAYSYVSKVGGKVMVHQTWAECEARVKGVSAARFKKSLNAADEQAIVKEFGGFK